MKAVKPTKAQLARAVPLVYCNKPTKDGPCDREPGHKGRCRGF